MDRVAVRCQVRRQRSKGRSQRLSIKCVEGGQPLVFVQDSDKKIFKLDGAEKVKSLIGDKVVLEGALEGETITISSAAKAE
jgi:hypothetical protein